MHGLCLLQAKACSKSKFLNVHLLLLLLAGLFIQAIALRTSHVKQIIRLDYQNTPKDLNIDYGFVLNFFILV